jgi:hypothetical protein
MVRAEPICAGAMPSMSSSEQPPRDASYRDRSVGLVLFGVVEILIGVFWALMIPLALISAAATRALGGPGASPELRGVVPGLAIYGLIAVAFVVLGIGSIRARRWARALTLVLSWLWLVTGVMAMVASWWLLPALWSQMGVAAGVPREGLALVMLTTTVILGFIYVVLPGAFVLFYRSRHVAATCRARDLGRSWIDDCPPHILSLVLIFGLGAVSVLMTPAYGFVLPIFGVVLSGAAGAIGWTLILALLLYLAWGSFRRDSKAWWTAFFATVFVACANTVTMAVVPIGELLVAMRLPADQRAVIDQLGALSPGVLAVLSLACWGSFLGYLLYVKRFFSSDQRLRV